MMDFKSSSPEEALKKFADWIESTEKKLSNACHCCPNQPLTSSPLRPHQQQQQQLSPSQNNHQTNGATTTTSTPNKPNGIKSTPSTVTKNVPAQTPNSSPANNHDLPQVAPIVANSQHPQTWKHVILYHQNIQNEVEEFGNQLVCELKRHLNEEKSPNKGHTEQSNSLEARWHKLWLQSLEQLVVVERTRRCPQHNSTLIGKSNSVSPANKSVARPQRRRPISYPNNYSDRLEWDYQHTLSLTGSHKENGSQIDLDSVDEQVTKNLTEFGENYELWFGKEDEIACVALHSRPASVEPAEQPEVAKAVVTSNSNSSEDVNCNLLMLTTPSSMFSVDASKCSHSHKYSTRWRIVGPFIFAFALLIFSALYHEPHHMHKSYYHTEPPV